MSGGHDSHGGDHGLGATGWGLLIIGGLVAASLLAATMQGKGPLINPVSIPVQTTYHHPTPEFVPVAPTRYLRRSYEPTAQDIAIARSAYKQIGD